MALESSQIESVFVEALAISDDTQRADFLRLTGEKSPPLRNRVEALLRAYDNAGHFLQRPLVEIALADVRPPQPDENGSEQAAAEQLGFLGPPHEDVGGIGSLGDYAVLEPIGRGGMGIVLKARDRKLKRVVALKVLAPTLAVDENARRRFLQEARSAASIKHDHVAIIHAIEEANGVPYLVMEYVEQGSLQDWLDRQGPLDPLDAARIAQQVAAGLAAAHEQGLVHRDIKPANILLENGLARAKITDFGIAGAAGEVAAGSSGLIAGTPEFMSPEQARNHPVDCRSDLFSLGCLTYAACTGRSPFAAGSPASALDRVCDDAPQPLSSACPAVPAWLDQAVTKLLAKDARRRFPSAADFGEFLRRHLADADGDASGSLFAGDRPGSARGSARGSATDNHSRPATTLVIDAGGSATVARSAKGPDSRHRRRWIVAASSVAVCLSLVAYGAFHQFHRETESADRNGGDNTSNVDKTKSPPTTPPAKTGNVVRKPVPQQPVPKKHRWELRRIPVPGRRVTSLAVSPDEATAYAASSDKSIYAFNLKTGNAGVRFTGHRNPTFDIALSPDGRRLASSGGDRTLRIWNAKTGAELVRIPLPMPAKSIAFNADGTEVLATLYGGRLPAILPGSRQIADPRSIMAFNSKTGEVARRLTADRKEYFWSIACSPTGNFIAAGSQDGSVLLIDAATGKSLRRLSAHRGPTHALKFSADGKRLYTGANGGGVCCWSLPDGKRLHRWQFRNGVTDIDANSGEALLLFSGTIELRLFDRPEASRPRLISIEGHTSQIREARFLSGGTQAITAAWDGTLRIWRIGALTR